MSTVFILKTLELSLVAYSNRKIMTPNSKRSRNIRVANVIFL